MDTETQPLLPRRAGSSEREANDQGRPVTPERAADDHNPDQQPIEESSCCKTCSLACIFNTLFYFLCLITGQLTVYFRSQTLWRQRGFAILLILSSLCLLIFIALNLASLTFAVYVIAVCPYQNCSYIFLHRNVTKWQTIVNSSDVENLGIQPEEKSAYNDWQKTVFTTASISGLLSYYFMILVLIPQYSCLQPRCDKVWRKDIKRRILSPFEDSDKLKATCLNAWQTLYFHVIFWFNFVLYISTVVVFYIILGNVIGSYNTINGIIDIAGLTAQFGSHLCAIVSCFIFSKVAYAVSNECLALSDKFNEADVPIGSNDWNTLRDQYDHEHTNNNLHDQPINDADFNFQPAQAASRSDSETNQMFHRLLEKHGNIKEMFQRLQDNLHNVERRHRAYITLLQIIDEQYRDMVKASLRPYGTWFAVHWVLYTLTAFMSIAYFAETVTQELYGGVCYHEHTKICRLNLSFILLFTLEHCILFLYPCFRAASVTAARGILIQKVSRASWTNIPHTVKDSFIKYLENNRSGFKVSILCTQIDFGYNIAYISIFVGIFGVILKLSF